VAKIGKPADQTRDPATVVTALNILRADLETLASSVAAGQLAPNQVSASLAAAVDHVHQLLTDLARQPDSALATQSVRREATALLLEVLTPRERQVTNAVLNHGTTALAAHALGMSEATLGHHRSNILRKLRATNFTQIARMIADEAQTAG
jgi:DNA-binding NarL/FixJ family response regulator